MRRNYAAEVFEVLLSLAVIALAAILFFKADELSLLYPVVFGLAAVLSFAFSLEGVSGKDRRVKKSRRIIFGISGCLLLLITWLSAKVVFG